MSKLINLMGQKFGRLTVIERAENDKYDKTMWLCQCECSKKTIVQGSSLKSGATKSCGCLNKENLKNNNRSLTHGHTANGIISLTYHTWEQMIQRCTNPNNKDYKDYGGRGIKVCKSWLKFEGFFQDMVKRPKGLSLDRIDNNGNYCKENCRWATNKEQHRNTRRAILVIIYGVTKPLAEWCEIYNMNYNTVRNRLCYGWTSEEALEIIPRKKILRRI